MSTIHKIKTLINKNFHYGSKFKKQGRKEIEISEMNVNI